MADLTAFSNKSYNAATWINAALKEAPADESLETYISSLSTKLHIMSQDYTDQLETAMVESMSTMPRILSEITRCEDQLRSVDTEMKSLSQHLNSFDQRNVAGVEDLSRLDTLKSNMEKCKATLEEHARWSQLVREAKIIMEGGGKLSDSADRIETMYRSLAILKNLPGNLEREETCETFKNSLLSALRPIVRRDVAGVDIAPLQEYLYVFKKLGRESEMQEEYVRARPDRIKSLWEDYSPAKHPDFAKWLAAFLGKVARLLAEEEDNVTALFGAAHAPAVLCDLLVEALRPLTTGLSGRLALLGASEAAFDAYCVMEEFSRRVAGYLQKVDESRQTIAMDAMFSGFAAFIPAYAEAEVASLRGQFVALLDSVAFSTGATGAAGKTPSKGKKAVSASLDDELFGEAGDTADAYGTYGERLLAVTDQYQAPIEQSLQRAVRFVGGLSAKQTIRAVAGTLVQFLKHLVAKLDDLRVASGFPRDASLSLASGGLLGDAAGDGAERVQAQQAAADRLAQQLELSEVDSRVLIGSALRALQAVGRGSKSFQTLEEAAVAMLSELQQSLFSGHRGTFQLGSALSQSQSQTAQSGGVAMGALYALRTLHSDLNSMSELRSFLAASTSSTPAQAAFAAATSVLRRLRSAASLLLFDLCIEAPEKMISSYAQEDVWGQAGEAGADLAQLKEHMLPQSVVTQVGEHLLSLVQELEAFAASDALPDLLRVRGEARTMAVQSAGWQALKAALEVPDDETLNGLCVKAKSTHPIGAIETTLLGSAAAAQALAEREQLGLEDFEAEDEEAEAQVALEAVAAAAAKGGEEPELDNAAVLRFVNEWLSAVADAAVGLLLAQILRVEALSRTGAAQLVTDLDYLSNVISATGIRPHPLLSHVRLVVQQDPTALLKAIDLLPGKPKGAVGYLLKFDHILIEVMVKGLTL